MTQTYSPGDRVILDRVAEIGEFGMCSPRFDRALYRAEGEILDDGRNIRWHNLSDGASRKTHGSGIPHQYLIPADSVPRANDGYAESPESFCDRLSKALAEKRRDKGTTETPEAVRSNPVDSQRGSMAYLPGDLVETVGDRLFEAGLRARVTSTANDPDMLWVKWEREPRNRAKNGGWMANRFRLVTERSPLAGEQIAHAIDMHHRDSAIPTAQQILDKIQSGPTVVLPERSDDEETGLMSADNAGRGAALAHGDRQKAYGHPKVSFDRIAQFWSTYLSAPQVDAENLSAEDVGHMMNLLKTSRAITDKGDDTLDDIEGYVTCIRMIRQAEAE